MAKFLRLIRNEWKKEFHKKAVWIMLIVLAVFSVLSAAISAVPVFEYDFYDSFEEMCEEEIQWNESIIEEASGEDLTEYYVNIEANRIMLDAGMDWEDWRYLLDLARIAAEAKYEGDQSTYEILVAVIKSDDPMRYYAWQMDTYKVLYANDAEMLAIHTEMLQYCIDHEVIPSRETDGRYALVEDVIESRVFILQQERLQASGGMWSEAKVEEAKNEVAIATYQLKNGILVNPADSFDRDMLGDFLYGGIGMTARTSQYWDTMVNSLSILSWVSIYAIVLAGSIVANEFSSGTVKFLLIAPVKRWKILASKYATVLLVGVMMSVVVFVMTLISALLLGGGDALLPSIYAEGGEIRLTSPYLSLLGEYLLSLCSMSVMATLTFALSTLLRKSSMAIGFTIVLNTMGSLVSLVLAALGLDWGRYLLFSNLDFVAIANGASYFPHQSLATAIVIVVLHMAVFLLTAYDAFVRREV